MHEAMTIPALTSDTPESLLAAASRATTWFGEPFLQPDEEPALALAPGTARRAALDDALAELDAGRGARLPQLLVSRGVEPDHRPAPAPGGRPRRAGDAHPGSRAGPRPARSVPP